ncbi:MAG TPA: hypothetical protein VEF90_16425 [Xanthobacteraceae bacterium]|nr:hypothetical protein [Xanthobacteraceae bacterium]
MTSFVQGQILTAAQLNAALAQFYPAGNVSAYVSGLLSQTSYSALMSALNAGAANGLATLDSTGRLPLSQLTASVIGAMQYQGTWNASTNSPTLTSSVGTAGQYYQVAVAGSTSLNGISVWNVGDLVLFNGSVWQKISSGAVAIPPPTTSTLGGVEAASAGSNQFMTGINTSGAPTFAQPGVGNLSGLGTGVAAALANSVGAAGGILTTSTTANLTAGYTFTPYSNSTGNITPNPALGNYQYVTNNGPFTITAPTSDCAIDLLVTNGASAGSVTFSGFTAGSSTGSALTTTSSSKFIISIRRINAVATYSIYALQ